MKNVNAEVGLYFSVVRYKYSFKRRAMLSKKIQKLFVLDENLFFSCT